MLLARGLRCRPYACCVEAADIIEVTKTKTKTKHMCLTQPLKDMNKGKATSTIKARLLLRF